MCQVVDALNSLLPILEGLIMSLNDYNISVSVQLLIWNPGKEIDAIYLKMGKRMLL